MAIYAVTIIPVNIRKISKYRKAKELQLPDFKCRDLPIMHKMWTPLEKVLTGQYYALVYETIFVKDIWVYT